MGTSPIASYYSDIHANDLELRGSGYRPDAHPGIVSKQEFRRIARMMESRAPKKVNPRRISSPYLLSGLAKCETCGKAMTAA